MLGARTTLSSMVEVLVLVLSSMLVEVLVLLVPSMVVEVLVLSSMVVEAAGALVVDTARGSGGHEDRPSSQLPDAARAGRLPMGLACCESIYWRPNKHTEKETGGCDLDWHFYLYCCLANQQDCL